MEKENTKFEDWFKLTEHIAVFQAFEASKYIVKSKLGGRFDISYLPLGKEPFVRIDFPHIGFPFHHLNINPKYTGKPDPHYKISPATYKTVPYAQKTAEIIGEVAFYLAVAHDTYKIGTAVSNDYKNKSSKETVDAATEIGGKWMGGYAGASLGAKVGTIIWPGFGTFLGGLGGTIAGVYYGQHGAEYAKEKILEVDYSAIIKNVDYSKVAEKLYYYPCVGFSYAGKIKDVDYSKVVAQLYYYPYVGLKYAGKVKDVDFTKLTKTLYFPYYFFGFSSSNEK